MGITRVYLDRRGMEDINRALRNDDIPFIDSGNSYYCQSKRSKFIFADNCSEWPDLEGNVIPMLPGEIAKTELKRQWPDLERVGWNGSLITLFDWQAPMYFRRPFAGWLVHIDLSAAYHQIYKRISLNMGWPYGHGNLHLAPIADRLKSNKLARNALVGITASRTITLARGYTNTTLKTKNKYLSPMLWAFIQSALNEIAYAALEFGAEYIATDGYIFPDDARENSTGFINFLKSYGYNFKIESGLGEVRGWMAYSTKMKTTKLYGRKQIGENDIDNVTIRNKGNPQEVLNYIDKCYWMYQRYHTGGDV